LGMHYTIGHPLTRVREGGLWAEKFGSGIRENNFMKSRVSNGPAFFAHF